MHSKLKNLQGFLTILKELKIPLLLSLFFFVFLFLFLKVLILPGFNKALSLRKELVLTNRNLQEIQEMLMQHPNVEEEIKILMSRQKELSQAFPEEKDFLTIAQKVIKQLGEQGLKLINFRYLYDLNGSLPGNFKKYGLELELITDYLKFGQFLENLEKKDLKFVLDKIKISRIEGGPLDIKVKIVFILKGEPG